MFYALGIVAFHVNCPIVGFFLDFNRAIKNTVAERSFSVQILEIKCFIVNLVNAIHPNYKSKRSQITKGPGMYAWFE